ncbi:MAG TPA: hypothetical protein G4O07_07810, partial [Dehalococcoidia bacterium]|nr:hypothetical protein [Dehalococcoidia bacterium]
MIRFVHIFNYAEGVSADDGEGWYLREHVPQAGKLPGVVRYRSWKQFDNGISFPKTGVPSPFDQFVRRTELCFETLQEALDAVNGNMEL